MNGPTQQGEPLIRMLFAEDEAAHTLGLEVLDVTLGSVRVEMTVRPAMANALGICHGGFIFALADSAFGYACNSYGVPMVASGANIDFVAPAQIGDRLAAVATESMRTERHGIYDVVVTNESGVTVAHFRGRCSRMRIGADTNTHKG